MNILLHEQEEENWKNSEVMQNFAEFYQEPREVEQEPLEVLDKVAVVDDIDQNEYDAHDKIMSALGEVDLVIEQLSKIASEAAMSGNVKAAYMVERSIEDIRATGKALWDSEQ